MRPLTDEEQKDFREDYRQTETEIQKNIAVYLSALVVATGWIFGPQAKPIKQLFLGNEGINLFGFIILIAVNVIFMCFLTYKSIQVHEIMQFVICLAPQDSSLIKWEGWRRSPQSLSKRSFTRPLYFAAIALVPLWASIPLAVSSGLYIWKPAADLAQQIQEIQIPDSIVGTHGSTVKGLKDQNVDLQPQQPPGALVERVRRMLCWARTCWLLVVVSHLVPIWFFLVTWLVANSKWKKIRKSKNMPEFLTLPTVDDRDAFE